MAWRCHAPGESQLALGPPDHFVSPPENRFTCLTRARETMLADDFRLVGLSARTIGRIEKISTIGKSCRGRTGCQPVRISRVLSHAVVQWRSRFPCDFPDRSSFSPSTDPCSRSLITWDENQLARRFTAPNPLPLFALKIPNVRGQSSVPARRRVLDHPRIGHGEWQKLLPNSRDTNRYLGKN